MQRPRATVVTALAAAAVALGAVAGPAGADGLGWYDAGAAVPASVALQRVAAFGAPGATQVVVAVGKDAATGDAAIFRRVGGAWQRDTVAGLPAGSALAGVAVTATAAWAVGSYPDPADASASLPLIVRLPGGATAAADAGWTTIDAASLPSGAQALLAVALRAGDGLIGDGAGHVYPVHDGGATGATVGAALSSVNAPAATTGLALSADGTGFAVGDRPAGSDGDKAIYAVDTSSSVAAVSPAATAVDSPAQDMLAVSAADPQTALAIDATGVWQPATGGVWSRQAGFGSGASLRDVSVVAGGAAAIAGTRTTDPAAPGTVWRRTGGGWTANGSLSAAPLNGVAVAAGNDIWAVGDGGTVLHYFVSSSPAPPPAPVPEPPAPPAAPAPVPGPVVPAAPLKTASRVSERLDLPVGIDQPPASRRRRGLLMTRVAVRRSGAKLVVSFVLSAPARVVVRGSRAGKVVASVERARLAAGRRRVALKLPPGPAPTRLDITVRRSRGARR
jgi:hypothetical protein